MYIIYDPTPAPPGSDFARAFTECTARGFMYTPLQCVLGLCKCAFMSMLPHPVHPCPRYDLET